MSRYIDADELIAKYGEKHFNGEITSEEYYAIKIPLDYTPTADVVDVVHGEWIMLNPSLAKCSVCGGYESTNGKDLTMKGIIFKEMKRYCPHCGARMDLQ